MLFEAYFGCIPKNSQAIFQRYRKHTFASTARDPAIETALRSLCIALRNMAKFRCKDITVCPEAWVISYARAFRCDLLQIYWMDTGLCFDVKLLRQERQGCQERQQRPYQWIPQINNGTSCDELFIRTAVSFHDSGRGRPLWTRNNMYFTDTELPEIPVSINEYLERYNDKEDIFQTAKYGSFHPAEELDLEWVYMAILRAVYLFLINTCH
ncbi:hypothetical protein BJV82DRAFT_712734 [Fennellomyces sp. T-0311]|nr:hypothetical protein BJV82DRAFT_712734 [Fennellomyces sp. T-0311]